MIPQVTPRYKPVGIKRLPPKPSITAENRYWNKFKRIEAPAFDGKINSLSFSPIAPHDLLAAHSISLTILNGTTMAPVKKISRLKDVAHCARFRPDGNLIVAGCEDSTIQVFDRRNRIVLRTINGHNAPVHTAAFLEDTVTILSSSDDTTIRTWDLATQEEKCRFVGHTDYVRCAIAEAGQSNGLIFSGSYDHSLRCWDARVKGKTNENCVRQMSHEAPIESILHLSSTNQLLSAGEQVIKIWDVSTGKLMQTVSHHQKTILGLAVKPDDQTRVVSVSLDQNLKIYETKTWKVTHTMKLNAPILTVAFSPNSLALAAGMVTGEVDVRVFTSTSSGLSSSTASSTTSSLVEKGIADAVPSVEKEIKLSDGGKKTTVMGGTRRYYKRGLGTSEPLDPEDRVVVPVQTKTNNRKLREFDRYLKKFHHRDALDAALRAGNPLATISLIEELIARGALMTALSGRNEASLAPLLKFLDQQVCDVNYQKLVVEVIDVVLDLYSDVLSAPVFASLKTKVDLETQTNRNLLHLLGSLDSFINSHRFVHRKEKKVRAD